MQALKRFSSFLLLTASLVLVACNTLGIPSADSFKERLAVGYATVTTVRQTTTTLLQAKKISAEDGQNILEQTNTARAGLDIARKLSLVDFTAANGKLTAISTVLTGLQTYLATKQ